MIEDMIRIQDLIISGHTNYAIVAHQWFFLMNVTHQC